MTTSMLGKWPLKRLREVARVMDAQSQFVEDLKEEVASLKLVCARTADALETWSLAKIITESKHLIVELRKVAK